MPVKSKKLVSKLVRIDVTLVDISRGGTVSTGSLYLEARDISPDLELSQLMAFVDIREEYTKKLPKASRKKL